jgi:PEP-CTERM motif
MRSIFCSIIAVLALSLSTQTSLAGVISVEAYASGDNGAVTSGSLGGYAMTSFDLAGNAGDNLSSISSPVDGSTVGITTNSNGGNVILGKADSTSWWTNNTANDFNIFKTYSNTIDIILPEKTLAFAFNVGASFNGSAWFKAYDENSVQKFDSRTAAPTNGLFAVGGSQHLTPGFGVYADNSNSTTGECSYISRITIDPNAGWGVGNFAIAQDAGNCGTSVAEPGSLALLGLGLVGLCFARRKQS